MPPPAVLSAHPHRWRVGPHLRRSSPPCRSSVVVSDYTQMDRILKDERNYILQMIKKIKASKCNVLLLQKSILRDAVTDLAEHYLAKANILLVKDIDREDIEFISKTLGCVPVAHVDHLTEDKLANAALVEEVPVGTGKASRPTLRPTRPCRADLARGGF